MGQLHRNFDKGHKLLKARGTKILLWYYLIEKSELYPYILTNMAAQKGYFKSMYTYLNKRLWIIFESTLMRKTGIPQKVGVESLLCVHKVYY